MAHSFGTSVIGSECVSSFVFQFFFFFLPLDQASELLDLLSRGGILLAPGKRKPLLLRPEELQASLSFHWGITRISSWAPSIMISDSLLYADDAQLCPSCKMALLY